MQGGREGGREGATHDAQGIGAVLEVVAVSVCRGTSLIRICLLGGGLSLVSEVPLRVG